MDIDKIEDRLRFARASEGLASLRRQLRIRTFAYQYKSRHVASQRSFMRSRTLQEDIEAKIKAIRVSYCADRAALWQLRGPGDWEATL
jgi:alpha-ketoglutarate-dependent taurine dioxygenase